MENITSQNTPVQNIQQGNIPISSGNFGQSSFQDSRNSYGNRFQRMWQAGRYALWQVWPYIQTFINFIVYTTIKVIKAIVRIGLTQTGLIKE